MAVGSANILGGQLDAAFRTGRGLVPGPVPGNYVSFSLGHEHDAAGAVTDSEVGVYQMPADFVCCSIGWNAGSTAGAGGINLEVSHNAARTIDGSETAMFSAAVNIQSTASGRAVPSGSTPTLQNRVVTRGRYIIVHTNHTGVADDYEALNVLIVGYFYGFANEEAWD